MTPKEIIAHQPSFFPEVEDWNAFIELANQRGRITNEWLRIATLALQEYFRDNPQEKWSCSPWFKEVDTQIYLDQFGPNSVCIGYGWNYEFHLFSVDPNKFNSDEIDNLLKTSEFKLISNAFDRIDRDFEPKTKLMNYRNFHFGSPNDGNIPIDELAWYAGNRTEEFVKQAVNQIEAFTKNEEVTDLIYQLNERTQIK